MPGGIQRLIGGGGESGIAGSGDGDFARMSDEVALQNADDSEQTGEAVAASSEKNQKSLVTQMRAEAEMADVKRIADAQEKASQALA